VVDESDVRPLTRNEIRAMLAKSGVGARVVTLQETKKTPAKRNTHTPGKGN